MSAPKSTSTGEDTWFTAEENSPPRKSHSGQIELQNCSLSLQNSETLALGYDPRWPLLFVVNRLGWIWQEIRIRHCELSFFEGKWLAVFAKAKLCGWGETESDILQKERLLKSQHLSYC